MREEKKVTNNIIMLYGLNIAQLALPLITLPYLTRVLSVSGYGVVSYVKSIMVYMTLIIEFGFILSGTKEIVDAKEDKKIIGKIIGKITQAKLLLSIISFIVLVIMIKFIPILHNYPLFTILSFGSPFLSIFLFDYLFRGLEKMQVLTVRYLIMKGMSTALTFIVIKNDSQINLIPILDIIGSIFAIIWIKHEMDKLNIKIMFVNLNKVIDNIRVSFTYFLSSIATTAFVAFNTLIVGIYLTPRSVAYWGVVISMVSAIQTMYSPISDGIYPNMIRTKSIKLFTKIVACLVPFLIIGSFIVYFGADLIVQIIGGNKYLPAARYLIEFIPFLSISFFSIMFGWPLLGAIGRVRETTFTTVLTAIIQVLGIVVLVLFNLLTITNLIILRSVTELFMGVLRLSFAIKYRSEFN